MEKFKLTTIIWTILSYIHKNRGQLISLTEATPIGNRILSFT